MDEKELRRWFTSLKDELETAYVRNEQPWEQSGYYGSEEHWTAARKPVADCIDTSGTFLDIGCANGYLLECILKWTSERNLEVIPFGIDISEKLIDIDVKRGLYFFQILDNSFHDFLMVFLIIVSRVNNNTFCPHFIRKTPRGKDFFKAELNLFITCEINIIRSMNV